MSLVVVALLALAVGQDDPKATVPKATVEVDRAKREVVITAGPFHVTAMPPGMKHEDMAAMNDHSTPLLRFEWPVDGWLRGFSVEVEDGNGKPVDRRVVHHLIGVNFDRRQLLYSNIERIFGVGQETEIGGRLLGYSGHLHDYGVSVRLEDVASGKVIGTVTGTRTPDGKITKISRSLPGVGGDGIRLRAGRTYRVIGTYDNPTGATIPGVMAHITGIFAPDDMSKWPKVDLSDEVIQDDLAWLGELGNAGHKHGGHDH